MSGDILKQLRETDFFKELSDDALQAVAAEGTVRCYVEGESIMRKGDAADSFFVILDGDPESPNEVDHFQLKIIQEVDDLQNDLPGEILIILSGQDGDEVITGLRR